MKTIYIIVTKNIFKPEKKRAKVSPNEQWISIDATITIHNSFFVLVLIEATLFTTQIDHK